MKLIKNISQIKEGDYYYKPKENELFKIKLINELEVDLELFDFSDSIKRWRSIAHNYVNFKMFLEDGDERRLLNKEEVEDILSKIILDSL